MGRTKRIRWERNRALGRVFEPSLQEVQARSVDQRGRWGPDVFGDERPITIELGCGYGDFTLELGRTCPERNVIGFDIKGHRFHGSAREAQDEQLGNVAFLRGKSENIEAFFAPDELAEAWLTFSDPQPKDLRGTKRMTSPVFFERYSRVVRPGGLVHIKSDSSLLYRRSLEGLSNAGYQITLRSEDVHGDLIHRCEPNLAALLAFQTVYERRWLTEGRTIHYLQVRL